MTLESTVNQNKYVGNGVSTQFPFTFKVWKSNQVVVCIGDGVREENVSAFCNIDLTSSGGTVTFPSAPEIGKIIILRRKMPFVQEDDYRNGSRFDPEEIEDRFDQDCAERQDLKLDVDRSLKLPLTTAKTPEQYAGDIFAAHDETLDAANSVRQWLAEVGTDVGDHSYVTASGGVTARTLSERFADWINVKDYGATGNGTTDDTEALQAAFDQAATSGTACVFFPAGEYRVSAGIKLGGNLCVYAYGATLRSMGSESIGIINNFRGYSEDVGPAGYAGNSRIYWHGGVFDGDGQNVEASVARSGGMFAHASSCWVVDAVFKNMRRVHAFEFGGMKDSGLINCQFYGNYPPTAEDYYPEIVQINPTTEISTPGLYADDTECDGILFDNCLFTNIENSNEVTASSSYAGAGAHGSTGSDTTKNITFRNCIFRGLRKYGVTCYSTNYEKWIVDNCTFDGVGEYGIFVRPYYQATVKSHDFTVRNCFFKNIPQAAVFAGYPENKQQHVAIENNVCYGKSVFGSLQRAENVFFKNNTFYLTDDGTAGTGSCFYMAQVDKAFVDGFIVLCGSKTPVFNDAVRFSNDVIEANALNVFCDVIDTPIKYTHNASLDGLHMPECGPLLFKSKQGSTTAGSINGAPAIALTGGNYNYPQIGVDGTEGFYIGAYLDNASGKSLLDKCVLYIKSYDNGEAPYAVCPGTQNTQACGAPSNKWSEVYAGTGTINTSDERQKDNIETPGEAVLRAWGKVRVKVFQFKDALERKGDKARLHVGIVAQDIQRAFAEEGLDASRYSLFCFDKWKAENVDSVVVDAEAVLDDEGREIAPAKTHVETKEISPAGESYGIRYEEALALECAYLRWRLEQIEKRVG